MGIFSDEYLEGVADAAVQGRLPLHPSPDRIRGFCDRLRQQLERGDRIQIYWNEERRSPHKEENDG